MGARPRLRPAVQAGHKALGVGVRPRWQLDKAVRPGKGGEIARAVVGRGVAHGAAPVVLTSKRTGMKSGAAATVTGAAESDRSGGGQSGRGAKEGRQDVARQAHERRYRVTGQPKQRRRRSPRRTTAACRDAARPCERLCARRVPQAPRARGRSAHRRPRRRTSTSWVSRWKRSRARSSCRIIAQVVVGDALEAVFAQGRDDGVGVGAAHLVSEHRLARLDQLVARWR